MQVETLVNVIVASCILHIPGIAFRINKRSAYKGNVISNVSFCSLSSFIISF